MTRQGSWSYDEALEFLGSRTNYERRDLPVRSDLRLDRIAMLLDLCDSPHRQYPVVHVAGTKGKGSTATMIAALLTSSGYKVGLHTSPHLARVEERFRIDGQAAGSSTVASLLDEMMPWIARVDEQLRPQQPPLTYFEITTALALWHFARERVDWSVIEVGMGGRLDSTNVVWPRVSVITSISRDHTYILGDDLASIAAEKAGIIKPGQPVVSGVAADPARQVIRETAAQRGSRLREIGIDFSYRHQPRGIQGVTARIRTWRREWPAMDLALHGEHQAHNCALALATLDVLSEPCHGNGDAEPLDVRPHELGTALETLRLPGRFEILGQDPTVVLDVAHNDASTQALAETLEVTFGHRPRSQRRWVLIFAASRDKEWRPMLARLAPLFDSIILTKYSANPRALPIDELANGCPVRSVPVMVANDPGDAWSRALDPHLWDDAAAGKVGGSAASGGEAFERARSLVCVTGSFYLVAELRDLAIEWTTVPA